MTSINLLNLAKIGQLDSVLLSVELVKRMLLSARQRLRDAEFTQNSPETRFDCAYTAIRTVADIGLHLNGFRTSTSKPGITKQRFSACPTPWALTLPRSGYSMACESSATCLTMTARW